MKTTKLKITGLILALMMVITTLGAFGITAFAAEGDATAKITGVTLTVDGVTYTGAEGEGYAFINPNSDITVNITGVNLNNMTEDNVISGFVLWIDGTADWVINEDGTAASLDSPASDWKNEQWQLCSNRNLTYTNDAPNWELVDTGILPIYLDNAGTDLTTIYFNNANAWETITATFYTVGDQYDFEDNYQCGTAELSLVGGESVIYSTTNIPNNAAYVTFSNGTDTTKMVAIPMASTQNNCYNNGTWEHCHTPETDDGNCLTEQKCVLCGETAVEAKENHTGGTATCSAPAKCEVCGTEYGGVDANNHVKTTWTNGFADCCNAYQHATLVTAEIYESLGLTADYVDYYAIGNVGQLLWYGSNNGEKNAVLVADIQIGTAEEPWINWNAVRIGNIFDGQNHKISLYTVYSNYNGDALGNSVGLFDGNNKTMKNLVLDGYIKCNSTHRVGGVSHSGYASTFENIISYLDIENQSGGHTGGIVGYFGYNGGTSVMTNCAVYADISGTGNVGGLVGRGWDNTQHYIIDSCAFYGTVSGGTYNGALVGYSGTTGSYAQNDRITNSYYIDTLPGIGGQAAAIGTNTSVAKSIASFESGEVAHLLGDAFGQVLVGDGKDALPVFATEENKVYYGYLSCANDAQTVYTNDSDASAEKPSHDWSNATCTEPKTCKDCSLTEGEALGHQKQAATCTLAEYCPVCEEYFGDELGHDIVIDEAVAATCTETGLTEGSHCLRCNDMTVEREPVRELGHTWGEIGSPDREICKVCGNSLIPEFEFVTYPVDELDESVFPYSEMRKAFPDTIEFKYENGKYMIKDVGATYAEGYTTKDWTWFELELVDGWWIFELDEEEYNAEGNDVQVEFYGKDRKWNIRYINGSVGEYLLLTNDDEYPFTYVYYDRDQVDFEYYVGTERQYKDTYENGELCSQTVRIVTEDKGGEIQTTYYADGTLKNIYVYQKGWHYYDLTNDCWQDDNAPEGYEDADIDYFTSVTPCTIGCAHEEYSEADCYNPERCTLCGKEKVGSAALGHDIVIDEAVAPGCITLGLTEGSHCSRCDDMTVPQEETYALGHSWNEGDTPLKDSCAVCGNGVFPEFEFINTVYPTLEESGFPYEEIRALFPTIADVKYEDGKYMIKDIGATSAEGYNDTNWDFISLTLEDGWWIYEISGEIYNDESIWIYINFYGETANGGEWMITYCNGKISGSLQIPNELRTKIAQVYFASDWVQFKYYVGDRCYIDMYENGVLTEQSVEADTGDDRAMIKYNADGTFNYVQLVIANRDFYYYYPGNGWTSYPGNQYNREYACEAPAGYENADIEFFLSLCPISVDCAHEEYGPATCEDPERCTLCGLSKEGSVALGHQKQPATCTLPEYCPVCDEYFGEALGHKPNADDGDCTTDITCSVCGTVTTKGATSHTGGTATCTAKAKCTACGKEYGEALGHKPNADDGDCTTDITCSVCGTVTTKGATSHTGGTATCTAKAKCTACGKEYGEALGHTHSSTWKSDANEHWNECSCGDKANKAAHADADGNEKCDACEYAMPKAPSDSNEGNTDEGNTDEGNTDEGNTDEGNTDEGNTDEGNTDEGNIDENDGLGTGAIVGIVIGSAVVVGVGGFSLFWFVIKKKSWADLLKVFKK